MNAVGDTAPRSEKSVESRLARYAELIVRVGANVQPGQILFVNGLVEHAPLVRAVTESAYTAGARYVDVRYADRHVHKAFVTHAADDDLSVTWPWDLARYRALSGGVAVIVIAGDPEPELLDRFRRAEAEDPPADARPVRLLAFGYPIPLEET